MTDQTRVWKVLVMLLVSMTVGTVVLMGLGGKPPVSGAFSLASYYQLDPMAEVIESEVDLEPDRWDRIQVTRFGDMTALQHRDTEAINAHFVVCNGNGIDRDGRVMATHRWDGQQPTDPRRLWGQAEKTIVIVMICSGETQPTNCQSKRTYELVKCLADRTDIRPEDIVTPQDFK
jgi:hypothetical protein